MPGKVTVQAFDVVSIQYPLPATAVRVVPVVILFAHARATEAVPLAKSCQCDVFTVPDVEGVCPLAGVVLIYKNVERTPVSVN